MTYVYKGRYRASPTPASNLSPQPASTAFTSMIESNDGALQWSYQLTRTDTISTVSTNATAPNLPGPGRILGNVLESLGSRLTSFINKLAIQRGLGPEAVAQEIRRLRRHHETTFYERHSEEQIPLSLRDEKTLKRYCEKLVKYARFVVFYPLESL